MNRLLIILLTVLICNSLKAQYYYDRSKNPDKVMTDKKVGRDFDRYYSFSWDINKPMTNSDFISQQSSLGTRFGFRKRLNEEDKLWVGGDFSWAVYKQYIPYTTYYTSNGATSTDLYNYSYNYALTANLDYMFRPTDKVIVPYGGLGIGLAFNRFAQYYNVYGSASDKWGLIVRPEVGVLIGFGENASWRMNIGAHFDYASTKDSNFGYDSFTNFGFRIGLVKMAW
jgi:hypothetical protein